jgi:predicted dehydrogenase
MSPLRSRRSARRTRPTIALGGAGFIAVVHALAAQAAGMRVSAVASAGGSSARHLAGELDASRVRPDQLPAGADVLVVATPPPDHVPLTLQGLAAGAHVLVEKPLATTLAGADRLVDAVGAAPPDQHVRCAENLLHAPVWRRCAELRPALGPLGHLSLRTLQPPPTWGHFTQPLRIGGVLYDLGPHALALALALAAEAPVGVSARLSSTRDDGADDHAEVSLRFASGLVAQVEVSWVSADTVWEAQAASDTGVLRLELLPEVRLEHDGEPVPVTLGHPDADPSLEQFGYVDQLLDLVAGDDATGQSVHAAREVLELICAAYCSAGTGNEVALPFTGDRSLTPMELWRGTSE